MASWTDQLCPPEGRATCTLTGLFALRESLEGFLQPAALADCQTSLIMRQPASRPRGSAGTKT